MKKTMNILLFCLIASFSRPTADAQTQHCPNLSFEQGDLTNWILDTRRQYVIQEGYPPEWEQVSIPVDPGRHILFHNDGELPPKFRYMACLAIDLNYHEYDILHEEEETELSDPFGYVQKLRYTMTIDSTNALLIARFKFILVYRLRSGNNQQRFAFTLFDQKGDTIRDCANYSVDAASRTLIFMPNGNPGEWLSYKDWTTVGVNLIKYWGQTVTIEFFSTDDHAASVYQGYALVTAECQPLVKTVCYYLGDSEASLDAPEKLKSYRWTDVNGNAAGNSETLKVANPPDGAVYFCSMTSSTGCTITQKYIIRRGDYRVDFSSSMLDCKSSKVQMDNQSVSKSGELTYKWDFGDGTTSSEFEPAHTYATSGLHNVTLTISKPPSVCAATLTKKIESFSPSLVGIAADKPFCYGMETTLKGYGALEYTWGDNSKADSLVIKPPGGTYKLVGRSGNGCVSDTIYKTVWEDPDWQLIDRSDSVICDGEFETRLAVTGAEKYLWSNFKQTSSIKVKWPGEEHYSVTGTNSRGCQKTLHFNVGKYSTPGADFITSPPVLYTGNNILTCSITPENDVSYTWDMGDGSVETGSTVQHSYDEGRKSQTYQIVLTATNSAGCTRSSLENVDFVPLVTKVYPPNAFSPNALNERDREFCVTTDGVDPDGYHFVVISRWNDIVFETRDEIKGWDGRMKNGDYASAGNYIWILEHTDVLGKRHRQTGTVTLVY